MTIARRHRLIQSILGLLLVSTLQSCAVFQPSLETTEYQSALTDTDRQLLADASSFNRAGYRIDHYRAPVPSLAPYATTLSTSALQDVIAQQNLLLIDVLPTLFRAGRFIDTDNHQHIPNSIWLPNTGKGELDPVISAYFLSKMDEITQGNRQQAVLFYCKTDCWMSWNASKRAGEAGYQNIYWYPEGIDGWKKAGGTLVPAHAVQP